MERSFYIPGFSDYVASLSRGPVCSNESRGELGDWAFNTAIFFVIISRREMRVRRIRGNPWCDLFFVHTILILLVHYMIWEWGGEKMSKKGNIQENSPCHHLCLTQSLSGIKSSSSSWCSRFVCSQFVELRASVATLEYKRRWKWQWWMDGWVVHSLWPLLGLLWERGRQAQ